MLKDEMQQLNDNQIEAVYHEGGPVYVIAGAGTGKTKTLTMRIAHLINSGVDPERILAVTFTNKAAAEIRQRVNKAIYPKSVGSWLYTFHAFGNKLLRRHAPELELGYTRHFTIIDTKESKDLIEQAMKELKLDDTTIRLGDVVQYIYNRKMENISALDEDYEKIYKKYVDLSIHNQLMDFTDLVVYTKELFYIRPDILRRYQNQFEHILIDEFQDTDKVQYDIIKMLNEEHNNVFVVGDPDQSIYSFRGARYENNELFIEELNAKTITLDKNYRSTNTILKSANKLIKFNKSRTTEKDLESDNGIGKEIVTEHLDYELDEVNYISELVQAKINEGYKPEQIAVLYRNNTLSRLLEHDFVRKNTPYVIYGGLSFYERKEIKDILAFLKLALDTTSDFFFRRVVNLPRRGIGRKTYEQIFEYAQKNKISMFEASNRLIERGRLSTSAENGLREFRRIINNINYQINEISNLKDIIDYIFDQTDYQRELDRDDFETREERYDNIMELKSAFETADLKEGTNQEKITELLDEITLFTEKESKKDKESVVLSTVHQVKGLEFEVVFIIAMEDDLFPNYRSKLELERLEEERRLFYVAITRAKKELYITSTKQRKIYGMFKFNRKSIFLNEI